MAHPRPMGQDTRSEDPFDVVMLGAGLGIYALTRAFHEEYGVVSTVLAVGAPETLRRSITCTVRDLPSGSGEEESLAALAQLAAERPAGRKALLLCNTDGHVEFIARNAEVLGEQYVLRYPSLEQVLRISDKARFAELCREQGVAIPETVTVDFRTEGVPSVPELPFPFPIVAKPAVSEPHVRVRFAGKKKVYFLEDRPALLELITSLAEAGFRDRFVLQELIPGDDTSMRSITAYRDAHGEMTLVAGAAVLLEEHTPDALGRPAAMITQDYPELFEQTRRLLEASEYVGYANVDVKEDARDGSLRFLEINPRIGRNNYYLTGAGVNVARFLVGDAVQGRRVTPVVGVPEILYSIVPTWLLRRYVTDPARRRWVATVARRRTVDPWDNPAEGLWMRAYARVTSLNQVRKFLRHYPRPTETGF